MLHQHHISLKRKERLEINYQDDGDALEDKRDILDKISALP